jgi:aspartate aminotransferase
MGNIHAAQARPVSWPLDDDSGWNYNLRTLESKITSRTKAIWINSPHNPTGAVLTCADVERIAAVVRERNLWLISDEAYEDVLFDGAEHVSPASLPGMQERTISVFTFSKSFAMTGLRLGYLVTKDAGLRERMKKVLFYTASNVTSIVQHGGIGALEGPQDNIARFRTELQARRDLFYDGIKQHADGVLSGTPPLGAFYAFLKIDPGWGPARPAESQSWAMAEHLITRGRIGCVPGVDFGARGEGYLRFCFARGRDELNGALHAMSELFVDVPRS